MFFHIEASDVPSTKHQWFNDETSMFQRLALSGEYPEVVSDATVQNLETPGAPLKGDSYRYLVSRVLAVVLSLAELLWIKRSINSARAKIWASKGSRRALLLSSTKPGEILHHFLRYPVASASTSPVTSSYADISSCAFESYEFPFFNALNL